MDITVPWLKSIILPSCWRKWIQNIKFENFSLSCFGCQQYGHGKKDCPTSQSHSKVVLGISSVSPQRCEQCPRVGCQESVDQPQKNDSDNNSYQCCLCKALRHGYFLRGYLLVLMIWYLESQPLLNNRLINPTKKGRSLLKKIQTNLWKRSTLQEIILMLFVLFKIMASCPKAINFLLIQLLFKLKVWSSQLDKKHSLLRMSHPNPREGLALQEKILMLIMKLLVMACKLRRMTL